MTDSSRLHERVRERTRILSGLTALLVMLPLAAFISSVWLGVAYTMHAIALDLFFWSPLALGVAMAARRGWQAWLAMSLSGAGLLVAHAFKLAMMGMPIMVADAGNAIVLLKILPGWRLFLAAILLAVWTVGMILALLPEPRRGGWLLLPVAWALAVALLFPCIASRAPASGATQVQRLMNEGGVLFLLRDAFEGNYQALRVPSSLEVNDALIGLGIEANWSAPAPVSPARNIHVVVLEAVWDVTQLSAFEFSSDPIDPRFRDLWAAGGYSQVLTPNFGGFTANAEFEVLCGLPAVSTEVLFETALAQPVPCLPRLLRVAGYHTAALHPYRPTFWSRDSAYGLLGFETYRPWSAFDLEDLEGAYLFDGSTYLQVRRWMAESAGNRPRFTYVVGLSSHYPYGRDRERRPDRVKVSPHAPMLEDYANSLRYATEAFIDHLEEIRSSDPDALVVAFGDHAPVLGVNPDPYQASAMNLRGNAGQADGDVLVKVSATPLIVINGREGVVDLGEIPLHQLPSRILFLLGPDAPSLVHSPRPSSSRMRPVPPRRYSSSLIAQDVSSQWRVCEHGSGDQACRDAEASIRNLETIRDDLVQGEQHTLRLLGAEALGERTAMAIEGQLPACEVEVEDWGPRSNVAGEGFNTQADGGSAFWIKFTDAPRGTLSLHVPGASVGMTVAGLVASANIGRPGWLDQPGTYRLRWSCEEGGGGALGRFQVTRGDTP